ncbi:hypothetical protein Q1695_002918 [Nippostrongylus brasiliensis]|nr:hypothetical protein Q1695_002918 [Nippostrongylus brasiliensis]
MYPPEVCGYYSRGDEIGGGSIEKSGTDVSRMSEEDHHHGPIARGTTEQQAVVVAALYLRRCGALSHMGGLEGEMPSE